MCAAVRSTDSQVAIPTRCSTALSSEVNLPPAINFRALGGAVTSKLPRKIGGEQNLRSPPRGSPPCRKFPAHAAVQSTDLQLIIHIPKVAMGSNVTPKRSQAGPRVCGKAYEPTRHSRDRTCPEQTFGHAGTHMGRAAGDFEPSLEALRSGVISSIKILSVPDSHPPHPLRSAHSRWALRSRYVQSTTDDVFDPCSWFAIWGMGFGV